MTDKTLPQTLRSHADLVALLHETVDTDPSYHALRDSGNDVALNRWTMACIHLQNAERALRSAADRLDEATHTPRTP